MVMNSAILNAQVFNRIQKVDDKVYYIYTTVVEVSYPNDSPSSLDRALKDRDQTLKIMEEHVSELASSRIVVDTEINTNEKTANSDSQFKTSETNYKSSVRATSVVDVEIKIISEKKVNNYLQTEVEIWVLPVKVPDGMKTYPDSLIGNYELYSGKRIAENQSFKLIIKKEIVFEEGLRFAYFDNNGKHFFTNDINKNSGFLLGRVSEKDLTDVSKLEYISLLPGSYRSELQLKKIIHEAWFRFDVEEIQFVLMVKVDDTNLPVKDFLKNVKQKIPNEYFDVEPLFSLKPRVVGSKRD